MSNLSRRILKMMSLFGGVQAVQIICSVVRTKLVALWIGTIGVGLFGAFNAAIDLLINIAMLGVGGSTPREIASAAATGSERNLSRIILVTRRISRFLGIVGTILTFCFASQLSELTFGNTDHTTSFRWLSLCVFLATFTIAETGILQGLSRLRSVARAMIIGVIGAMAVSVPLFYFLGVESIVPSLVLMHLAMALGAFLCREKGVHYSGVLSIGDTVKEGRGLLTLGIFMTVSTIATYGSSYAFMAYLTTNYGSSDAGLFQAGYTLTNRYVSLIFSAIAMEYYPRLSRVAGHFRASEIFVSHELKIVLAVVMPAIAAMAVFAPLLIKLFYSSEFYPITSMIEIGVLGTVFRAISWCMAFVILARGDGRIFVITELISAALYFIINVIAWRTGGIGAMGYAYTLWYALYTVSVALVFHFRYKMRLRRGIPALALSVAILTTLTVVGCATIGRVATGIISLPLLCYLCYRILRNRPIPRLSSVRPSRKK